jgi:hypothetical protein
VRRIGTAACGSISAFAVPQQQRWRATSGPCPDKRGSAFRLLPRELRTCSFVGGGPTAISLLLQDFEFHDAGVLRVIGMLGDVKPMLQRLRFMGQ